MDFDDLPRPQEEEEVSSNAPTDEGTKYCL